MRALTDAPDLADSGLTRSAGQDGRDLAVANAVARWLDNRLLDPALGLLLPGAGDILGAALGAVVVVLAWRRGAPKVVLARMLMNLTVDTVAGLVPVIGDVYDFFFRAHARNLDLLRARTQDGVIRARRSDTLAVIGALLLFVAALALPVVLLVAAVKAIVG